MEKSLRKIWISLLALLFSCSVGFKLSKTSRSSIFYRNSFGNTLNALKSNEKQEKLKKSLLTTFDRNTTDIFANPESLTPLKFMRRIYGLVEEKYFIDPKFGKRFKVTPFYYDLTVQSENEKTGFFKFMSSRERVGQKFFQNPFISGIYENGYRQNFESFGFPGIEAEFKEVKEFFTGMNRTGVVMDLSCGSGFMTRRLIKSGCFDRVIAADLSPNMLMETRRRCEEENIKNPEFVRCDSAKLPFASNSLDAIHAGAAMHCWPNLNNSLSEIYRVLKPGGVFFASTFFTRDLEEAGLNQTSRVSRAFKRTGNQQGFYFFDSEDEIQELVENAGFKVPKVEEKKSVKLVNINETDVTQGQREVVVGDSIFLKDLTDGGRCKVRREGTRCAIVKAVKAPVPINNITKTLFDM